MSLVQETIPNFIGGVNQQPDRLKFTNQLRTQKNCFASPVDGLLKRPPTEHIAKLMSDKLVNSFTHTIVKEDEKYKVILTGSDLKVFDLAGNPKTVSFPNGKDYITTDSALNNLGAVSIGDYTFILNKTKITSLKDDLYINNFASSALIFVRQGDYSCDYKIKINDTEVATYSSNSTDIATTKTTTIAADLKADLIAAASLPAAKWSISAMNSVILIKNIANEDFKISVSDSNGDRDIYCFYKETSTKAELPLVSPDGFILKIVGQDSNKADDYFLRFKTTDGSTFGQGGWQECPAPNIKYKIDATTMPHALIRQADGTFKFDVLDWQNRLAGDEDSAKTPSFIGNTINEVLTHKCRLAFLSVDKSIYSDVNDIFSFFKQTTLTELDSDPIDVNSNSKMVDLKHSIPYAGELILISETSEFTIKGDSIFSSKTVSIDLVMEYECSKYCKPVGAGNTVFFPFETGAYAGVREIYTTSSYTIDANNITTQVPNYIPTGVHKMAVSTLNSLLCLLSSNKKDTIYTYKYYYTEQGKIQSSWGEWLFEDCEILNMDFIQNILYLVVQYSDGVYLEKIDLTLTKKDAVGFKTLLDRKIYTNAGVFNGVNTVITLPYIPVNDVMVIDDRGFNIEVLSQATNTITIAGDYSNKNLIVGCKYTAECELPTLFVREQSGTSIKVKEGVLMLRDLTLSYVNSGYFKALVTPLYGDTSTYEFTGIKLGTPTAQLEQIPISDGSFLIPILAKNDEVTITLVNDSYLPSSFIAASWEGDFTVRGQ